TILKFDSAGLSIAPRDAIWEARLYDLNVEAEPWGKPTKQENHTLFIGRCVRHPFNSYMTTYKALSFAHGPASCGSS
ncbi:MAG TPA: hypothetical protein VNM24_06105, partial [Burkholderiales bacterium]|nr:hypothetical protein [Burkholderiales bacterium]